MNTPENPAKSAKPAKSVQSQSSKPSRIPAFVARVASRIRSAIESVPGPDFSDFGHAQRRNFAWFAALMTVVFGVAAFGAFFLALRGSERVMVPDVRGMDLAESLVKLQERELYPRLSLRFTDNPADRNTVLEQTPRPGSIVKAGRRIQLIVSRGAVLDKVEDYIGRDLEEVKLHLQSTFAASRPLISIREPPMYSYHEKPAGTILEQKPPAGTGISGPTVLDLVVSMGPESRKLAVADYAGMTMARLAQAAGESPLTLDFSMRAARQGEKPGTVVTQEPKAGTELASDARVKLTIAAPAAAQGVVNGVYVYNLPAYPYPVPVRLESIGADGRRAPILSVKHPGGNFSAPFSVPEGSTLVLSALDREVARSGVK